MAFEWIQSVPQDYIELCRRALACEAQGDLDGARTWYFRAVAQEPEETAAYLGLGKIGCMQENWQMIYAMAEMGYKAAKGDGIRGIYDYGAIGAYRMGLLERAKAYSAIARDDKAAIAREDPKNSRRAATEEAQDEPG